MTRVAQLLARSPRPVILTSDSLKSVTFTGDAASAISANLTGATTLDAGSITGNAAANTVLLTADAADTISVDLGAGNDVLSIGTISATHTIAGGDGIDSLVAGTSISATTGANISGFEAVRARALSLLALPAASNTIGTVSFTGTGRYGCWCCFRRDCFTGSYWREHCV